MARPAGLLASPRSSRVTVRAKSGSEMPCCKPSEIAIALSRAGYIHTVSDVSVKEKPLL
jgi:hypothetical protein